MAKTAQDQFSRFTRAPSKYQYRLIGASYGEAGTGKTSFWLGAPGPIVVQTLDAGLEGVVEAYTEKKDIYVANYDLGATVGETFTHAATVEARDKFIEDFEHALRVARTIIWDRESDVWNMFYYAEFGTDDAFGAAAARDWDKLKGKLRRMIAMAKATTVNLGLIQGMKNEWGQKVNSSGKKAATPTGRRIRSGMDDLESLVHMDLEHTRENGEFSIRVNKSRGPGGSDVQDQSFAGTGFVDLAQLVFPDSDESDWT